jgi:hypothetical protein
MYIGNDLQIAHPSYKIIDDISSGFNGSTTSFALQVSGATPVPFPISTQQVMISVNGVVQEPDPNGSAGFKLLGSNIVFSSAPANGHAFFGVINAGADYVTAGSEFPDGSATAPSFTFQDDQDTGWFRSGSGAVGFSANGVNTIGFDGNGLTVTGDATFTGDSSKNLFWDKSDGQLEFADNAKAVFGTGSDLQIYHNGSKSYIKDAGTGSLNLNTNLFQLTNAADSEVMIKATEDGAVELYYDNVKTFNTESWGNTSRGQILKVLAGEGTDATLQLICDDGDDNADMWQIFADASHGGLNIQNYASGSWETNIAAYGNNSVELYYDNSKKFETTSAGVNVTGHLDLNSDTGRLKLGAGDDLSLYHDGSNSYIVNTGGTLRIWSKTDEYAITAAPDGAVELFYDNSKKFETKSDGATISGSLYFPDATVATGRAKFGASDDLQIFHDGSHNYIEGSTGDIILKNSSANYFKGVTSTGAVELNHNGSKKFETTTTGVTVTGTVSDSKGDLRKIPINAKSSSYTLISSDAGKTIRTTAGVTVPSGVFYEGEAITIFNDSGSDITITQGSNQTMYNAADAATGNRTLAGRGLATVLCFDNNEFVISGAGLS